MITAVMCISRAISVLCLLPLIIALYRRYIDPPRFVGSLANAEPSSPTERTALLSGDVPQGQAEPEDDECPDGVDSRQKSASQELVVSWFSFLLDGVGLVLVWRSENAIAVALCT